MELHQCGPACWWTPSEERDNVSSGDQRSSMYERRRLRQKHEVQLPSSTHAAFDFHGKVHVARGVDQIDLVFLPFDLVAAEVIVIPFWRSRSMIHGCAHRRHPSLRRSCEYDQRKRGCARSGSSCLSQYAPRYQYCEPWRDPWSQPQTKLGDRERGEKTRERYKGKG